MKGKKETSVKERLRCRNQYIDRDRTDKRSRKQRKSRKEEGKKRESQQKQAAAAQRRTLRSRNQLERAVSQFLSFASPDERSTGVARIRADSLTHTLSLSQTGRVRRKSRPARINLFEKNNQSINQSITRRERDQGRPGQGRADRIIQRENPNIRYFFWPARIARPVLFLVQPPATVYQASPHRQYQMLPPTLPPSSGLRTTNTSGRHLPKDRRATSLIDPEPERPCRGGLPQNQGLLHVPGLANIVKRAS